MEQVVIWQRMAERWLEAADEVPEPALKRCYRERAANYERLAAHERDAGHGPAARRESRGGAR